MQQQTRFETLGDRMKSYESVESSRKAMKGLPLLARLDGRSFHTYTKFMNRPYDDNLTHCMIETTKYLVKNFGCVVGYTQSDEISLMWYIESDEAQQEYIFDGKYQKICSNLAASASAFFARISLDLLPEKDHLLPTFDCRVWQTPSLVEAANVFYWRELDATKNAISMAASTYFSNKELHKLNGAQKQELLFKEHGINFNDYPPAFKRGTYVKRVPYEVKMTHGTIEGIPVGVELPETAIRHKIEAFHFNEPCSKLTNYKELLFRKEPVQK